MQNLLPKADVIMAVGTEISETDSFLERLNIAGDIIRIDIDSKSYQITTRQKLVWLLMPKCLLVILEALGPAKVRQSNGMELRN